MCAPGQARRQDQALRHVAHEARLPTGLSAHALAQPDEVEPVVVELEAGLLGDLDQGLVDRPLEAGRHGEVAHRTAARADQVVVVLGEVLGQLEAGPLVGRDDLLDDAGPLEDRQVAVDGALGQVGSALRGSRGW